MKEEFLCTVDLHDTDAAGLMRPSAVLRTMQNATNAQMQRFSMDAPTLLARTGRAFLLSRLSLRIYHPIYAYDRLQAYAWPNDSRGFSFLRNGQVLRDGVVVAEMATVWAFVEAQSRKILRVCDFDAPFDTSPALDWGCPARIVPQKDAKQRAVGSYTVAYRDVDLHRHMNNTNYPDLLYGYLNGTEGKRLAEMDLIYQKEAPLGEQLQVFLTEAAEVSYLRTVRSDGCENVRAQVKLTAV